MDAAEGPTIGALLKRHRTAAGLTQEELAERAEVSARTVSDAERGLRTTIYRDTAKRLADALGLADNDKARFERAARGARGRIRAVAAALPQSPTRLIGRVEEVADVVAALERDGVRLLTLTGPGGIGKTRIALEAARQTSRFAGEVFFVPFGAVVDARLVVAEIAHAVGVTWAPAALIPAIADQLRDRETLLVLDTLEHVLGAAEDVAQIIASAPGVHILATSREALRLSGEHELTVATLATPAKPTAEDVAMAPASALFLERARAVNPAIKLDDETAGTIAAICSRLDGLPLAIELAAARTRHLPLERLLQQLEHALDVLTGGPRDLPQRQRTMRDTVAWSEGLLEPEERSLFHELSVFAGGWTLEAASAVCTPGADVLAGISALVDKSLVQLAPDDRDARYAMLDVVREFAIGDLSDEITRRHAAYFLSLALTAEPNIGTSSQAQWFNSLAVDQDNFREALRHAIGSDDAETAIRLSGSLWQFWRAHGHLAEGRAWLGASLALDGGSLPIRAKALWGAAWLAYHQADYDDAEAMAQRLATLSLETDDPIVRRNAFTVRGMVAMAREDFDEAVALFDAATVLLKPLGKNWLFATSLLNLGSALVQTREGVRARSSLEDARNLYEQLGDRQFEVRARIQLGFAWMIDGELAHASTLIGESLRSSIAFGDTWATAESLQAMSAVRAAESIADEAATLGGAAEALWSTITVRPLPFDAALIDSFVSRARAETDEATWRSAWDEGVSMALDDAIDLALTGSRAPGPTR